MSRSMSNPAGASAALDAPQISSAPHLLNRLWKVAIREEQQSSAAQAAFITQRLCKALPFP